MPHGKAPQLAVVGHLEWVEFARAPHLPRAGEIVEAEHLFYEPAGGGAVAAVQLARLAGHVLFITALGDDATAALAAARLCELGVELAACTRPQPTRRALTLLHADQPERTIVTLGERLEPAGEDLQLPWQRLAEMDAVYFTAGDLAALRHARAARRLLATPRAGSVLEHGIPLDALVLSRRDLAEQQGAAHTRAQAELLVCTEGDRGGTWFAPGGVHGPADGAHGPADGVQHGDAGARRGGTHGPADGDQHDDAHQSTWAAVPAPGPALDSYGCGDSFAAGLTYGLARGWAPADALALAARCGAVCLTGRGPYQRQLSYAQLSRASTL